MEQHIQQIIPGALNKSLEQVPQELKQPKSGEIARFEDALKQHKLVNGDLEEVKESLRYAMVKIGLRAQNWPNEEEKTVLISHVLKGYGGHTAAEIRLAFDMALEGKLDVETNCYENFSCLYFSNIMSAYREWAKQEYEQLPQELPAIEYKEDMSDRSMTEWFNAKVREFELYPDTAPEYAPLGLYEWLDRKGRIDKTAKEKHAYLRRAVIVRHTFLQTVVRNQETDANKWKLIEFEKMQESGCFTGDEMPRLKNLAKQLIMRDILLDKQFRL